MGKAGQLQLLLWKNFLIQRRKIAVTFFEIALPTVFALILIFLRQVVDSTLHEDATTWPAIRVDEWNHIVREGAGFPACLPSCQLYYSPNTSENARSIMNRTALIMGNISDVVGFEDEETLVANLLRKLEAASTAAPLAATADDTLAGVVFTRIPSDLSTDAKVEYKLRFPSTARTATEKNRNPFSTETGWQTEITFPIFNALGPRNPDVASGSPPPYLEENFLKLQYGVDSAIISEIRVASGDDADVPLVDLEMRRAPYPPYLEDGFVMIIQEQLPMIIMLSFVFYSMQIVKDVVHEKENKLKESMKMMGLSGWLHWIAWFIKYFIFILISVIIETVFFTVDTGSKGRVMGHTNPIIVFLFLISYGIATIMFGFALSTFFSKANSAAAAGGILFFITYVPYFFIQPRYESMNWSAKIACCLLSNVGMALGGQVIGMFEGISAGVQWHNINKPVSVDDDFTMLNVILMLLLDSVIYGLIAWYVEAIRPGEFGIPQPLYFPFTKTYWFGVSQDGSSKSNSASSSNGHSNGQSNGHSNGHSNGAFVDPVYEDLDNPRSVRLSMHGNRGEFFEPDPQNIKAGIRIQNLRKEFTVSGKKKVAVNGMTLNMYEGQITALLGHNGAGKTTTMSILTGFLPPTSGTAVVNGYDILQDLSGVRSSLGLCPQHNVLFDTLTVEEHLVFFTKLKGFPKDEVEAEVDRMIEDTGLQSKRHALSSSLSGGMKRKLCVGIALVANSKVVILDEPTSGMDPNARRQIWDLLQRHRTNRTMVLSTHFMDEADLLGDRIAIMAAGVIQCCGTPLFLKNKYGSGYHMVIVKEPGCDVEHITTLVSTHVPDARLESDVSAELSYVLPQESKASFEALWSAMDLNKAGLKIASYGASVTTMEEVFLRVGNSSEPSDSEAESVLASKPVAGIVPVEQDTTSLFSKTSHTSYEITSKHDSEKNTGFRLYAQQFYAMLIKRVIHTARNRIVTLSQLLVPLVFTIIALVVIKTLPKPSNLPPMTLNLARFSDMYAGYTDGFKPTPETATLAASYADWLQSLRSVTPVYLNNQSEYASDPDVSRYLVDAGVRSIYQYNNYHTIALDVQPSANASDIDATAYFNNQAYHASATSLNAFDNALFGYVTSRADANITTVNHPLPRTITDSLAVQITFSYDQYIIAYNSLFGLAFLSSSFALFLLSERAVKAKHQQIVSGVHAFTFWASTFIWDYVNFVIPCCCIVVSYVAFDIEALVADGRWAQVTLLYFMFGWATLPFMYLWSFAFKIPSSGYVWLTIFNILSGIGTFLIVAILVIPELNTQHVAEILEWIFLVILPNFCLGQGLKDFYTNYLLLETCGQDEIQRLCEFSQWDMPCCKVHCTESCLHYDENYLAFAKGGIGRMLVFMAVQGFVYFTIVFMIEFQIFTRLAYWRTVSVDSPADYNTDYEEDSDVSAERKRINEGNLARLTAENSLVLVELTKRYGGAGGREGLLAVDRLSVAVEPGECFGLLGINGAGKTSTFQMLTGDSLITSGTAYLGGYNIKVDLRQVQRRMGYCPQFDALIDQMTARETLYMYGRLRGVKETELGAASERLIDMLQLTPHADKLVKSCSGGNKRKLSTAVALIGDPQVVFLDEPSTGVDPVARRHLWTVLSQVRASGKTLVLTSHSMEECDALCTKITVMVNGQFKCLGSPQHLKNKFGEGFTVIVKLGPPSVPSPVVGGVRSQSPPSAGNSPVKDFIESTFPGSILKDEHQGLVHYQITDPSVTLGRLFGTMEAARERLNVEDYSVSQTTLEQVLINFARAQVAPQDAGAGGCCGRTSFCCGPICG